MKLREALARSRRSRSEDGYVGTAISLVMAGLAVAGAATSAAASYSQAQSQKAASDFNSKVAKNNASAMAQQASANAALQRNRMDRLRGAQQAAEAKAGVSGGSASDVTYDTSTQGELDALTTLYKGQVGSNQQLSQSQLDVSQGQSAMTGGYLSAGGTLLSGAGGAMRDYSSIRNQTPDFGYG